jgi:hypothetical protein
MLLPRIHGSYDPSFSSPNMTGHSDPGEVGVSEAGRVRTFSHQAIMPRYAGIARKCACRRSTLKILRTDMLGEPLEALGAHAKDRERLARLLSRTVNYWT